MNKMKFHGKQERAMFEHDSSMQTLKKIVRPMKASQKCSIRKGLTP